ncbi:MAG: hypothetical protein ABI175_13240, partial [Polyangiales bacterium]
YDCLMRGRAHALIAAGVLVACASSPGARTPIGPGRQVTPGCVRGTFAAELDRHLPPLSPIHSVSLFDAAKLDPLLEPGCILPFHEQAGIEAETDVGRVVVRVTRRRAVGDVKDDKPRLVGRGTMRIGRNRLHLEAHDDAGGVVLSLGVEGRTVHMKWKGTPDYGGEIALDGDGALPLPLDALVAAIDRCDADERLGASEDGNLVEARRLGHSLWRARYLESSGAYAIDTSVLCGENDARLAWRTAAGDTLAMLVLASVRSEVTLLIERQPASATEDFSDPGMAAGDR